MKELQYKRNLPGNLKVPYKDLASCPFNDNVEPKCKEPGGCLERDSEKRCTFSKIQTRYSEARVPMVSPRLIVEKIVNMCDEYLKVKKRSADKSKMNQPGVIASRDRFIKELAEIFPAYHPEAEAKILSDPSLTEEMKQSDILFLKDQMTDRKFRFSGRDKNYDKIVKKKTEILERKRQREEMDRSRFEKEKKRQDEASTSAAAVHFNLFEDNETEISLDSDVGSDSSAPAAPEKRSRPGGGQLLFIPDNIIQLTAEAASGAEVSPKQQQKLTAAMIVACGGDIDNFFLGSTYAYKVRRDVEAEAADRYREDFMTMCKEKKVRLVIHLDGKLSKQIDKLSKKLKDRLSVVVRSPDLPHGEFLLGIPELEDGSGK